MMNEVECLDFLNFLKSLGLLTEGINYSKIVDHFLKGYYEMFQLNKLCIEIGGHPVTGFEKPLSDLERNELIKGLRA